MYQESRREHFRFRPSAVHTRTAAVTGVSRPVEVIDYSSRGIRLLFRGGRSCPQAGVVTFDDTRYEFEARYEREIDGGTEVGLEFVGVYIPKSTTGAHGTVRLRPSAAPRRSEGGSLSTMTLLAATAAMAAAATALIWRSDAIGAAETASLRTWIDSWSDEDGQERRRELERLARLPVPADTAAVANDRPEETAAGTEPTVRR